MESNDPPKLSTANQYCNFSSESGNQLLARLEGNRRCLFSSTGSLPIFPDGLEPADVIEISGDSGSGKTELILNLVAGCILPTIWNDAEIGGQEVGVVLVDTDQRCCHSVLRLASLVETRLRRFGATIQQAATVCRECLSRLMVLRCGGGGGSGGHDDARQFFITLQALDSIFHRRSDFAVLVVDSLSVYFQWPERQVGKWCDDTGQLVTDAFQRLLEVHRPILIFATWGVKLQKGGRDGDGRTSTTSYNNGPWHQLVTTELSLQILPPSNPEQTKIFANIRNKKSQLQCTIYITDAGITYEK